MRLLAGFIGKNRDFKAWLAAQLYPNKVIYLQRCEICGRMARGSICRRCEPLFRRWTKKVATVMAARKKPFKPIIA